MSRKNRKTLKEEVLELALEIADRLDFGCSIYEQRVYTEWNAMIEENRRDDFLKSLEREKAYTKDKIDKNPMFGLIPDNPYTKIYNTILKFETALAK